MTDVLTTPEVETPEAAEPRIPPLDYMRGYIDHTPLSGMSASEAAQMRRWLIGAIDELAELRDQMLQAPVAPAATSVADELSPTEVRVFRYLRNTTMSQSEIAKAMYVSINTTKTHAKAIYRKLGVDNRSALRTVASL